MTPSAVRHAYLDWVRGLAVLIMIEAHVLDSWTRAADRSRPFFGYAMVLGGMGAPLFLFLAGVSLVLSAGSKFRKTGDWAAAWDAVQRRGWQVFGLAFLFRLQSYILSGGQNAPGLLKVDILNVMGPAIAMAALVGRGVYGTMASHRSSLRPAVTFLLVAITLAMVTPIVRITPWLDWLPDPVEWYFRPTPGRTNFTLFPWAGFVFAGATVGVVLDASRAKPTPGVIQAGLAAAAVTIAAAAYTASFAPSIYTRSEFWTSSPTYFFVRVGILTFLLPVAYLWGSTPGRHKLSRWSPLEEFGTASLFVYWIHVEMVYGFFSRPLRRSLSLEGAVAAYAFFTVFLLAVVLLKNRVVPYLTDSKSVISVSL